MGTFWCRCDILKVLNRFSGNHRNFYSNSNKSKSAERRINIFTKKLAYFISSEIRNVVDNLPCLPTNDSHDGISKRSFTCLVRRKEEDSIHMTRINNNLVAQKKYVCIVSNCWTLKLGIAQVSFVEGNILLISQLSKIVTTKSWNSKILASYWMNMQRYQVLIHKTQLRHPVVAIQTHKQEC